MSEESVKCVHEKDGMKILGTVIGFDCQGCVNDAQAILAEAVKIVPAIDVYDIKEFEEEEGGKT